MLYVLYLWSYRMFCLILGVLFSVFNTFYVFHSFIKCTTNGQICVLECALGCHRHTIFIIRDVCLCAPVGAGRIRGKQCSDRTEILFRVQLPEFQSNPVFSPLSVVFRREVSFAAKLFLVGQFRTFPRPCSCMENSMFGNFRFAVDGLPQQSSG